MYGHCITKFSVKSLLLTGGYIENVGTYVLRIRVYCLIHLKKTFSLHRTNKTWFFSWDNHTWTIPGPDLIEATDLHQCESFIDVESNDTWLVVSPTKTKRRFQFLNFNQPHEWIEGPIFPTDYDFSHDCFKLVSGGTYLHFINTCTRDIFKLECEAAPVSDACQWVLQEQSLKYPRIGAVVSLIPDYLTNCT